MFSASSLPPALPRLLASDLEHAAPGYVPPFQLLSRRQVAEILDVSVRTLDNWQKCERMPKAVDIGGRVYWHSEVFYGWLDQKMRSGQCQLAGTASGELKQEAREARSARSPERLSSASRAVSRNQSALARMASGG